MGFYPNQKTSFLLLMLIATIFLVAATGVLGQEGPCPGTCQCQPGVCCSRFLYCGIGSEYCGSGCMAGPCYSETPSYVSVADVVTEEFFNRMINKAADTCEGKGFYTRTAFLDALNSYTRFGTVRTVDDSKREIAAFFAHVTFETINFCYIREKDGQSKNYCDLTSTEYPCAPNQHYYGRGPMQLSWNYNYGLAGKSICFDGLNEPDLVATNSTISFKTALLYWIGNCHDNMVYQQDFGATIRAINPNECDGGNPSAVTARVGYYTDYCDQLQVDPGNKLRCDNYIVGREDHTFSE